ncbi:MAG TPA: lysophospholipid acyltransferase family protein [Gammaproteobacteria bacterium]
MKSRFITFLFRTLALLPLPLLHGAGKLLGLVFFLLPNRHRAIAARNLQLCFPQLTAWQRWNLLRRTMEETGKTILEVPLFWCASQQRLRGLIKAMSGEALMEQAMAASQGMITVSPHIGAWELIGQVLAPRYHMTIMYRPPRYPSIDQVMRNGREHNGAHLAPADASGIKVLMQSLRQGKMIGILPDQDPRDSGGVFAPFFGIATNTMTLLPRLAQKSGAAVIYCFAERLSWGRGFHLHFIAAPEVSSDDMGVAANAVNGAVEQCIRLAPAQYQWSYKRFRTRPAGEPPLYD